MVKKKSMFFSKSTQCHIVWPNEPRPLYIVISTRVYRTRTSLRIFDTGGVVNFAVSYEDRIFDTGSVVNFAVSYDGG